MIPLLSMNMHTYIPNCSLQPFLQDYDIASHTPPLVCVVYYMSGGTYNLRSTPNYRVLRNFSSEFYLVSRFLP